MIQFNEISFKISYFYFFFEYSKKSSPAPFIQNNSNPETTHLE